MEALAAMEVADWASEEAAVAMPVKDLGAVEDEAVPAALGVVARAARAAGVRAGARAVTPPDASYAQRLRAL